MQRTQGFRYAVLGILSSEDHGLHGWAIKRQCELTFGCVWEVSVGRVYRALGQLRAAGFVEPVDAVKRTRKVVRISARGRQELHEFLRNPGVGMQWVRRDEFATRLLFSGCVSVSDRLAVVERERQRCEERLYAVMRRRRTPRAGMRDACLVNLLLDGAEMEVRARLAWLDRIRQKLRSVPADQSQSAA